MALTHVLRRFEVPFDVVRQPPIVRDRGRVRPAGETQTLSAKGSFQPATAKDLQRVPEGQRTDNVVAIFTDFELLTGDAPDTQADRVINRGNGVYSGVEFEIQSVKEWPTYRKYLAIKVGQ